MTAPLRGLDYLLFPCESADFISSYLGRSFLHVLGKSDKFDSLLSWRDINSVLETQRLGPPRFRLACESAPSFDFEFTHSETTRRGEEVKRINRDLLLERLRDGYTLIFDAAEEAFPPVRELSEDLGGIFGAHVQANLYASWGSKGGFGLHWDDHDVFVLQLDGKKRWEMFPPTREFPLYRDIEKPPPPEGEPQCEIILNRGDMLYVPRGYWHDVHGLGGGLASTSLSE